MVCKEKYDIIKAEVIMMNNCDTTNLINRLKRIEGQVRGIQ